MKINIKKNLNYFLIIFLIFVSDRLSKMYIINLAELKSSVDIYINSYLNLYLIWNKGIAFGMLSFDHSNLYNLITVIIVIITFSILILSIKSSGIKKYFFLFIIGGSLGNLFDRFYYSAVPDFIDLHINDFHWFIFNVADIFITLGVICLIYVEIFVNNEKNEKLI
jgi:signal peptidase II